MRMRQDIVSQAVKTDKLFDKLMDQTTENHKQFAQQHQQFATLTGQFAVLAKENADASRKVSLVFQYIANTSATDVIKSSLTCGITSC